VIALQPNLSGAHAERARELTEPITNALAHVERLMFFAKGDGCRLLSPWSLLRRLVNRSSAAR
jgi:hypothetical protein